jgi:hypothetical protein
MGALRAMTSVASQDGTGSYGCERTCPLNPLPSLHHRAHANHHRPTGSRQEAFPPHSQAPACHRRCFPRRDQGAPYPAPRGPRRRPLSRRQGRKGEEGRRRVKEEGREGQERVHRRTRPGTEDPEQAGRQGCRTQGPGKDSLSGLAAAEMSTWVGVLLASFSG